MAVMHACLQRLQSLLFFSSEVSGEWTKWIQFFQVVKRSGDCAGRIPCRNSCDNITTEVAKSKEKTALPFAQAQQGASAQNNTGQWH
jgi:hypothetical protein